MRIILTILLLSTSHLHAQYQAVLADGKPAADCVVHYRFAEKPWQNLRADPHGKFQIPRDGKSKAQPFIVVAHPDATSSIGLPLLTPPPKPGSTSIIQLQAPYDIGSRAVFPDGTAAANATVTVLQLDFHTFNSTQIPADFPLWKDLRTDKDGNFRIRGAFAPFSQASGGTVIRIVAERDGTIYSSKPVLGTDPALGIEDKRDRSKLVLQPHARFSGTITDAEGKPVAGAQVERWGSLTFVDSETDEQGRFTTELLPLGAPLQLIITQRSYLRMQITTKNPAQASHDMSIQLTRAKRSNGRVSNWSDNYERWRRHQISVLIPEVQLDGWTLAPYLNEFNVEKDGSFIGIRPDVAHELAATKSLSSLDRSFEHRWKIPENDPDAWLRLELPE